MGKAKSLKKRVASYFSRPTILGDKTKLLLSKIHAIHVITVGSELESLLLEANLIKKFSPPFNVRLTDGKAYPLIRITVKDKYPKVLISRRMEDKKSLYFGPYPKTSDMRLVLKTIRRIFPFQSVQNHPNRPCLYYHLGLCPCPTVFGNKSEYKKTMRRIISFLNGNVKEIVNDLEKERDIYSKKEMFEEAKAVQAKITAILRITEPIHKPLEYEVNPNLREDLRKNEIGSLEFHLKNAGLDVSTLKKIECFDISNIMGKFATGSMVVFIQGERDSSQYRRFRVRLNNGKANDVLMMKEVLLRRLKNAEWPQPDLIIVDGGKGQVTAASEALQTMKKNIPIIGLAKKEEIIITQTGKIIRLSKDEPALHLLMRIRDEAHRFAVTYHRKLRSKYFLSSQKEEF